ncbi:beta-xylosidase [Paenibacillus phyllosphaerae]|uniref:Beta-xylosidase n=1 Tax=Paenibacillus phyllosphaerae TaxID=274593 RepID=A0A7W5AYX8_9BACL|nr:family 43 glycosylhydrolase [Paenibacillus phyllosphaerae]MBB3111333.1 beta-xylosidase [Paenibacillus phyllosphaerae]
MKRSLMSILATSLLASSLSGAVGPPSVASADSVNPALLAAAAKLTIPNAEDVRGNITLPGQLDVDGQQVTITWDSSNETVITDTPTGASGQIPAGVVTRQSADQFIDLTATLALGGETVSKIIPLTVTKAAKQEAYAGYMYTYFRANLYGSGESQQIHLATSQDGLFWDEMNKNEPILTSTLGTKGVRDSFIVRAPEGDRFYLIATDLDANGGQWGDYATKGSKSIMVWESDDLLNWSDQRMIEIAPNNAGNMWAPETIYDKATGEYIVYFASNVGDGHRIYYVKTRDFWTFTEPAIYKDKTSSATYIDTNMIEHSGSYYRFTKNENDLTVLLEKSNAALGEFSLVRNKIANEGGVEGPASFKLNGQDKWVLLLDGYASTNSGVGFFPLIADSESDLAAGNFRRLAAGEFRMPTGAKHGGIIPVTKTEYDAIQAKWGQHLVKPVTPDTSETLVPDVQYKFDETVQGTTVLNSGKSGAASNGTLVNGAAYRTDAQKGNVLYLAGGNGNTNSPYLAFPKGYFDGKDNVTIFMDMKSEMDNQFFFTLGIGQDQVKYYFLRTRASQIYSALTIQTYSKEQSITSALSASLKNTWTNIAVVLERNADGIHSTMKVYKDGVLLSQLTNLVANLSTLGENLNAYLGKSFYAADPYFKGSFDNVRVYNRALTDAQVGQVYNQSSYEQPGDREVVDSVIGGLTIPNAGDVRGNVTLPAAAEGASITWSTNRPDVIQVNPVVVADYDDMPGGIVTRQNADVQLNLTATVTYGTATGTKVIPLTVKAKAAQEAYQNYLFTHFTGESATGEQIYLATSQDGLRWQDLNQGDPVLTSTLGEQGVRDPYLIRSPEGDKFYLIATDLRIASGKGWGAAQTAGSKSLIIWESDDLINWSAPRMAEVAVPTAGYAWAPEAIYDEKTGEYVVFWASSVQESGTFQPPNIYYSKTRDFYTFTEPKVYIDRPGTQGIIDTTMIESGGQFYRYSGDGQITIETSDQILGDWTTVGNLQPIGLTGSDVEGPLIYKFNDRNEWSLMVDQYATGRGYLPLIASDLASGSFTKLTTADYNLDANRKRHGSVLPITQREYDAIMAKWSVPELEEEPQQQPVLQYKFDETSTDGAIQDSSGNNRSGALSGNAKYVHDAEKNSNVLYLDGTSNTFASFPTGFFDRRNTVTISMDIKPETVSGNFFTFAIGKDNQKYMFLRTRDTEIRNAITQNSYSNEQEAKATTPSIKSKWMNVSIVLTPTSMTLYKDGVQFAKNENTSVTMTDLGSELIAYLGQSFYSGDLFFKGYFDNVKVYNRALSATEIASELNAVPVQGITLSPATEALAIGESQTLTATVTPSNATNKTVSFVSSSAAVNLSSPVFDASTGTTTVTATGVSGGEAVITAKTADGSLTATSTLAVSGEAASNLLLWYKFDETSGTTAADSSGYHFDGTYENTPAFSTGVNGGSFKMSGGSSSSNAPYVTIPNGILKDKSSITVATFVKWDGGTAFQWLYALGIDSNKYAFLTPSTGGSQLNAAITNVTSASTGQGYTAEQGFGRSTPLETGVWKHVAAVIDSDAKTAILYVDGIEAGRNENVTIKPADLYDATKNYSGYIGKSFYSPDPYFAGEVDDFRIYDEALSPAEILALSGNTAAIVNAEVGEQKTTPLIDGSNHRVTFLLQPGSDVTKLAPTFTLPEGASISPASGSVQDFTNPVTYTVTGADDKVQSWTVAARLLNTPILPGLYADPNVAVFGNKFYLYQTTDGFPGWSGTQFKVFSSDDLVHWKDHGLIFDVPNDTTWAEGKAWAPAIEQKNGKYYFYFSADSQIGVAVSDSPTGPFVDALGKPLVTTGQYGSGQIIDPAVFTDEDGQSYLYFGQGRAYVGKLNEDMISLSEVKDITPPGYNEGSFVFKRDGKYYFMWSENDTRDENYRVAYAIGDTPMGPFTKQTVVLQKDLSLGIRGTGHHSVVKVPGTDEYYIVYHRFAIPDGDGTHREVTIDRMEFNADGTIKPVVPTLEGIEPVTIPGQVKPASLQGPAKAAPGETFGVSYALQTTSDVYAQDVTVSYDPEQLEFVSAESVNDDWEIAAQSADTPGKVRLIAANVGGSTTTAGNLFKLTWKVKATEATISTLVLANVVLADNQGAETVVQGNSYSVQITANEQPTGDLNGDTRYSVGDLAMVASYYGKTSADPQWNALYGKADQNGDGKIDIVDIVAVARLILQ